MNTKPALNGLSSILIAAGLVLPALSSAQLDEIVVTAQKREQGVNDVGITVNAFDATQLDAYGVQRPNDLEALVPGLTITNDQPAGVPVFTIRGVGFQNFSAGSSSTVGLYLDETNIPYSVLIGNALYDLERVEVLKGPQGDLYGRNTTAGQINFVSKKPTEEFAAGVELSYGRYELLDTVAYVSGPLSDNIKGRLAATYLTSGEGWQQSLSRSGDKLGELDEFGVRGLLDFRFSDNADLLLNLHYYSNRSENIAGTTLEDFTLGALGPLATSDGNPEAADWTADHRPENDNESVGVSARLNWEFTEGLTLTSITAWDDFERNDLYDTSGIPQTDADSTNQTDISVFSQELRFEWTNIDDWYVIAGLFYSDDKIEEDYLLENGGGILGLALGLDGLSTRWEQNSDSIAVFGHTEWQFTEKFRLTLGARYTQEERDWTGCTFDSGDGTLANLWNFILTPFLLIPAGAPDPGMLMPGECGVYDDIATSPTFGQFAVYSQSIETNKAMGKITLDYAPTEDVLLYGTISSGFKSGGFNGAAVQTHQGLIAYKPEELVSLELGIKSTLLDNRLQLNAAAFHYSYDDKQQGTVAVTPVGNIVVAVTNIPESKIFGAELESRWQLTDGLIWDVGLAYLDTEIEEYQQVDPVNSVWPTVVTFDASGESLDNSPDWQANSTLTYIRPITGSLDLLLAGDVTYKGDSLTVNQTIDGYTLYNARVGVSDNDGRWSLMAWGRNITDEYYFHSESISNCCSIRLNGQPETYGVTFSYNW